MRQVNISGRQLKFKPDHREAKELLGLLDNVLAVRNYSFVGQITE